MIVYRYKTLTSTNEKAREFKEGSVIIADAQTKGRGRFGRNWSSKKGGIYLSIILKPKTKNPAEITFMAALALQRAIKKACSLETKLKWPNDVLYENKKLAGILTENIFKKDRLEKMVVGIGLNANNPLPKQLKEKSASLKGILGKAQDKEKIIAALLKEFKVLYDNYKNNKDYFKKILAEWKDNSHTLGKKVRIVSQDKKIFYGRAVDVDNNCNLIIRLKDGRTKKIIEGDVFAF